MRGAPMRQPTARRKLMIPVPVNVAAVLPRTVCIVIANAGAYDGRIISWTVIVRIWIAVIVVRVRPIIACRIITGVVCQRTGPSAHPARKVATSPAQRIDSNTGVRRLDLILVLMRFPLSQFGFPLTADR